MLGLSIEDFAKLIEKSPSTVNSLESGRLALSGDTAFKIALETGVALDWLLKGDPEQEPYVKLREGAEREYTLAEFQKYRATRFEPIELRDEVKLILAFDTICPWISVFFKAAKNGQAELARWLMQEQIEKLADRFGKDDEAALKANEKTGITIGNDHYMLVEYNGMRLGLLRAGVVNEASRKEMTFLRSRIRRFVQKFPTVETLKNSASPPSPESVRPSNARKSASPRRRRRGVPATG